MKKEKFKFQISKDKEVKLMKHILSDIEEEEKATGDRNQFVTTSEDNTQIIKQPMTLNEPKSAPKLGNKKFRQPGGSDDKKLYKNNVSSQPSQRGEKSSAKNIEGKLNGKLMQSFTVESNLKSSSNTNSNNNNTPATGNSKSLAGNSMGGVVNINISSGGGVANRKYNGSSGTVGKQQWSNEISLNNTSKTQKSIESNFISNTISAKRKRSILEQQQRTGQTAQFSISKIQNIPLTKDSISLSSSFHAQNQTPLDEQQINSNRVRASLRSIQQSNIDLKIRTNIDDNYEIHSTSSKSIEKGRAFNLQNISSLGYSGFPQSNHEAGGVVVYQRDSNAGISEDDPINKFLNTYDKEYSMFFERIDKIKKSNSRERVANSSSVENKNQNHKSFLLGSYRMRQNQNDIIQSDHIRNDAMRDFGGRSVLEQRLDKIVESDEQQPQIPSSGRILRNASRQYQFLNPSNNFVEQNDQKMSQSPSSNEEILFIADPEIQSKYGNNNKIQWRKHNKKEEEKKSSKSIEILQRIIGNTEQQKYAKNQSDRDTLVTALSSQRASFKTIGHNSKGSPAKTQGNNAKIELKQGASSRLSQGSNYQSIYEQPIYINLVNENRDLKLQNLVNIAYDRIYFQELRKLLSQQSLQRDQDVHQITLRQESQINELKGHYEQVILGKENDHMQQQGRLQQYCTQLEDMLEESVAMIHQQNIQFQQQFRQFENDQNLRLSNPTQHQHQKLHISMYNVNQMPQMSPNLSNWMRVNKQKFLFSPGLSSLHQSTNQDVQTSSLNMINQVISMEDQNFKQMARSNQEYYKNSKMLSKLLQRTDLSSNPLNMITKSGTYASPNKHDSHFSPQIMNNNEITLSNPESTSPINYPIEDNMQNIEENQLSSQNSNMQIQSTYQMEQQETYPMYNYYQNYPIIEEKVETEQDDDVRNPSFRKRSNNNSTSHDFERDEGFQVYQPYQEVSPQKHINENQSMSIKSSNYVQDDSILYRIKNNLEQNQTKVISNSAQKDKKQFSNHNNINMPRVYNKSTLYRNESNNIYQNKNNPKQTHHHYVAPQLQQNRFFIDTCSDDSTIQEEAPINDSKINVGDYNSIKWNQYQVEMHVQDLISQIESYLTSSEQFDGESTHGGKIQLVSKQNSLKRSAGNQNNIQLQDLKGNKQKLTLQIQQPSDQEFDLSQNNSVLHNIDHVLLSDSLKQNKNLNDQLLKNKQIFNFGFQNQKKPKRTKEQKMKGLKSNALQLRQSLESFKQKLNLMIVRQRMDSSQKQGNKIDEKSQ
ncbi:UNKNOWN [Stylonychia lemnae]|uniref:Uncharacterized protein n=1 Tax=Stylonychia lemnae TaxID=5949 RepID=A0A078AI03_STYLE|nr:UNKNOWN [Stylonychia lemnae]|eukprot:CDW81566.1 UNKNOWN [Stylonychia lemnae]